MKNLLLMLAIAFVGTTNAYVDLLGTKREGVNKYEILCFNGYVFIKDKQSGSLVQFMISTNNGAQPLTCNNYNNNKFGNRYDY